MNEKPDMFEEVRKVVSNLRDAGDEWAIEKMMEDINTIFLDEAQKEINRQVIKEVLLSNES